MNCTYSFPQQLWQRRSAACPDNIWILANLRCRTSDVRHRIIPTRHTMSYVHHVRHRTCTMSYVVHVRHRMTMSYVMHVRHRNVRCRTCIDIVCQTNDIVCHIVYDIVCFVLHIVYDIVCFDLHIAYDIVCFDLHIVRDIAYDIVCDVHSIETRSWVQGDQIACTLAQTKVFAWQFIHSGIGRPTSCRQSRSIAAALCTPPPKAASIEGCLGW